MRDVAAAAGVSVAAVSLALSGNPRIPTETRDRIAAVAREMGYRPHAGARALRTELTGSLGLVISDVANPFFAELAGEIQRAAAAEGFSTVLCNSDEDARVQDEYLQTLLAGSRVDGVILVPAAAMTAGLEAAGKSKARLVFLDRPVEVSGRGAAARHLAGCPVVRSAAADALAQVADLLTGLGHRRIGIIAPPMATAVGVERTELMITSLTARGVAATDITVAEGDFRQDSGERAVSQLLGAAARPTAIFGADGLMTIGAIKGLRAAGLRIPADVSVVGFDDAPWFDLFDPPLTAVAQPIAGLATAAVRAMIHLVDGSLPALPDAAAATPPCALVRRASCGPAPA
ncbi:substrate-binding domain-containing protein [Fodinicola acaciae]|uniref:substrate-binding domain-containing protein n=1 Tax=Fodinicola acaciae TaxID=2681555 RepID=UPI0013D613CC|nr:substrate-binding domain-containing protein [Fodinicola acaciae]